jgi:uncharacterized protein YkwD
MAPKLAFLVTAVLAFVLAGSASALALGVQFQRTAERSNVPSQPANSLIAPTAACPDQANASTTAQEQSMRCMIDFARAHAGLGELDDSQQLDLSAAEKAGDVLRCNSFSHTACGREFTYWMDQAGYTSDPCWHVGENLAFGTGTYGMARSIFQAWMRSPTHRQNILGDYEDLGLSRQTGELDGRAGATIWAAHFGSHCDAATTED